MSSLATVAMGLVIVFLDVGSNGWDWIADPVGWGLVLLGLAPVKERLPGRTGLVAAAWGCLAVSVLTLPPGSVDSITPTLGWLFSLPTIGFCVLLCAALAGAADGTLGSRFRVLTWVFVVAALLPALVYLGGWEQLTLPTAVVAVLANLTLVFSVWAASESTEEEAASPPEPRRKDQGFDAEAVKRRVRRERARRQAR